jgi:hypothetical protein
MCPPAVACVPSGDAKHFPDRFPRVCHRFALRRFLRVLLLIASSGDIHATFFELQARRVFGRTSHEPSGGALIAPTRSSRKVVNEPRSQRVQHLPRPRTRVHLLQ